MKKIRSVGALCATCMFLCNFPATALAQAPDVTYEYDDLGRLKKVEYGDGKGAAYFYDAAGNRQAVVVDDIADLPTTPPTGRIIVVLPLNGFTVIPVR